MTDEAPLTPLAALSGQIADLVTHNADAIVAVHGRGRVPSSGLLWRSGVVVTAEEALEHDEDLSVTLADGRRVPAALAGRDPSTDIAVLRLEGRVGAPEWRKASPPRSGALVVAVGRRDGEPLAGLGIVSLSSGAWRSQRGGQIDHRIDVDLRLDPRGEGGALVDAEGALIGMAVYGPRRRVLAIPAAAIERVADQLLARGRIARGYLGAGFQPVRLDQSAPSADAGQQDRGLLVVSVDADGPARQAGLLLGDIVTGGNGAPVRNLRDVIARLGPDSVGQIVDLSLIRAGAAVSLAGTVGERPTG